MIHFNTLGNGLKRGLLGFSKNISKDFPKTTRRFVADMIFGIIASNSCKLTDIGRALKEDTSLKKVVDRLGRNLAGFSKNETLMANYLAAVRSSIGANTMLLIDGGDVTKPCSPKMEAIGSVYDASTGAYGDGYWTMGVVALTENRCQPIPVYEKLYPCTKQGGSGFNAETKTALQYLRDNFDKSTPRIFDRGFDSGEIMQELVENDERFIMRQNQNRKIIHNGKTTKTEDVVRGLDCRHTLRFHSKTGNVSTCKIGMTSVVLPNLHHLKLNMVVCKEFGENPLVLYTNLDEKEESIAVRIVKAYLMRWRIEEFYAFKKQGLKFEDFRVRGLDSIRTLDLLLTVAIGYIGTLCAKVDEDGSVLALIFASKRVQKCHVFLKKTKFLYYALLNGISCVFAYLRCGISYYFLPTPKSMQISLPGF